MQAVCIWIPCVVDVSNKRYSASKQWWHHHRNPQNATQEDEDDSDDESDGEENEPEPVSNQQTMVVLKTLRSALQQCDSSDEHYDSLYRFKNIVFSFKFLLLINAKQIKIYNLFSWFTVGLQYQQCVCTLNFK